MHSDMNVSGLNTEEFFFVYDSEDDEVMPQLNNSTE